MNVQYVVAFQLQLFALMWSRVILYDGILRELTLNGMTLHELTPSVMTLIVIFHK
jgi:hypothetical protein